MDGGASTEAIAMMTGETIGLGFAARHEFDDKQLGLDFPFVYLIFFALENKPLCL